MSHTFRPLVIALGLALALPALAAKPAPKKEAAPVPPAAAAEFELAHNLGPEGEQALQGIVDRFNKEAGGNLKLGRLEKGEKPAALNLILPYDIGDVLTNARQFVPLHEVMAKSAKGFNAGDLTADLKAGVVDAKGRLVALPLAYSTPVMFYDKAAFRKARLDPEKAPVTWFEMQGMLDKLQEAGYSCPYTTSWPVWVHVDNVSSVSGVPSITDKGQLAFNGLPQVKHIAMMATWTKANYFKHFGRRNEASKKFLDGECAMITTNSREHIQFSAAKGRDLGVALMPYHDDVYGGRQPGLADGATLWVGAGRSPAEYAQIAKFVTFMLAPDIQVEGVRVYGSLPMTSAARAAVRSKLLQGDSDRTLEVAYHALKGKGSGQNRHVADIDAVRIITDEELEDVWANKIPAKAALDNAVNRGNAVLAAKPALKKAQPF